MCARSTSLITEDTEEEIWSKTASKDDAQISCFTKLREHQGA